MAHPVVIVPSMSFSPYPLLLPLALSLTSPSILAQAAPLADLPCLGRVCLGDDAQRLSNIPWQPVVSPSTATPVANQALSRGARELVRSELRGAAASLRAVAPYWLLRRFDALGFEALQGVVAVCTRVSIAERPRASYISRDGHRTVVTFEPTPAVDGRALRFVVASITQRFDAVRSGDEVTALRSRIRSRYPGYPTYAGVDVAGVRVKHDPVNGSTLTLLAPFGDWMRRLDDLRSNPACTDAAATSTAAPAAASAPPNDKPR